MLTVVLYAAAEYPEFINFNATRFSVFNPERIMIDGLEISFLNEVIAITNTDHTLWLNSGWTQSPFVVKELLPRWPMALPR